MQTITIPVAGMSCGGCVASVQKAVGRLGGVAEAKAELQPGQVTVRFDPSVVSLPAIVESVEDAGYSVPAGWQAPAAAERS